MSALDTIARRCAYAIMRHVKRVMPHDRLPWVEAMQREIEHINNDRATLSWALGCLFTGYSERIRTMDIFRTSFVRSILALTIVFEAWKALFEPMMVLSYRLHVIGIVKGLGGFTPGDDYRRFISLMIAIPLWLEFLGIASGILYLASAWKFMRSSAMAFSLFASAMGFGLLGTIIENFIPGLTDARRAASTFAHANFRRDILIPVGSILLTAFIALALWWFARSKLKRDLLR